MKRTALTRKTPLEQQGAALQRKAKGLPRTAKKPRATERARSSIITRLAHEQGIGCTLRVAPQCFGSVCLCHVRGVWALGMATKPADWFGFYGCAACHAIQEARECDDREVMRAIYESQSAMFANGAIIMGETA